MKQQAIGKGKSWQWAVGNLHYVFLISRLVQISIS